MLTNIPRPAPTDHAPAFGTYISLVPDGNLLNFLRQQLTDLTALQQNLSEKTALLRHPPYTWSIKQVLGHIIDAERIFAARTLRIARNDPTPLPSFDENAYVANANFDQIPLKDLLEEFTHTRQSNILLFQHIPQEAWQHKGIVNNHPTTANTFPYAIAGHTQHHLNILKKRLA